MPEQAPVYGFDSFQGLPGDWRNGFPKAAFDLLRVPYEQVEVPGPIRVVLRRTGSRIELRRKPAVSLWARSDGGYTLALGAGHMPTPPP